MKYVNVKLTIKEAMALGFIGTHSFRKREMKRPPPYGVRTVRRAAMKILNEIIVGERRGK